MKKRYLAIGATAALGLIVGIVIGVVVGGSPSAKRRLASSTPSPSTSGPVTATSLLRSIEPITVNGVRCSLIQDNQYAYANEPNLGISSADDLISNHGAGTCAIAFTSTHSGEALKRLLNELPQETVEGPATIVGPDWVVSFDTSNSPLPGRLLARVERETGGSLWSPPVCRGKWGSTGCP